MSTFYTWVGAGIETEIEQVDSTIEIDDYGVGSAIENFIIAHDLAVAFVMSRRYHPEFGWLKRKKATIKRAEANQGLIQITYEGVPSQYDGDQGEDNKRYSLRVATYQRPIETHKDFKTFAGKSTPGQINAKGAKWDADGLFEGFVMEREGEADDLYYPTEAQRKTGLRTFDDATVNYTETWVKPTGSLVGGRVDLNAVGKIDTPPSSSVLPDVNPERTWMLAGADIDQVGDGLRIVRQWNMSGERGHDPDVYEAAP